MDIDKLIERLRDNNIEDNCHDCALGYYAIEAAEALSVLRGENDRLKNMYQKEKAVCHATQAELQQVKRQRDAAVECIQFIATYLELNSTKDIRKTIEAWKSGLKEV